MKHYAGLDVSMKETFVCVVDQSGKKICDKRLPTDTKAIVAFFNNLNLDMELIGLESGSMSHWLTTELQSLGLRVKCIDARHIAAVLSVKINKTDRNDARGIADAMRCELYKEVKPKTRERISLMTLLNGRQLLVEQRVVLFNCVRGLFKPYGINLGSIGNGSKAIEIILTKAKELPEAAFRAIQEMMKPLLTVIESIKELDKQVKEQAKANKDVRLLMSIPGVGSVTALRFVAEIGDPGRFMKSKPVGAYIGMTPRQYSSGEIQKQGRISKCGPKALRTLLVEAGVVILSRTRSWSKLKAWGLRIQKRNGFKKAAVAIGRKLSVIMHRMLVTKEPFKFTDKEELRQAA